MRLSSIKILTFINVYYQMLFQMYLSKYVYTQHRQHHLITLTTTVLL